jgi:hypothetical protein
MTFFPLRWQACLLLGLLLLSSIGITSCNNNDDDEPDPNGGTGPQPGLRMQLDGQSWQAAAFSATYNSATNELTLTAQRDTNATYPRLTLMLASDLTVQDYAFGPGNPASGNYSESTNTTFQFASGGSFELTKVTDSTLSGEFNGTLQNSADNSSIDVTAGEFQAVPLSFIDSTGDGGGSDDTTDYALSVRFRGDTLTFLEDDGAAQPTSGSNQITNIVLSKEGGNILLNMQVDADQGQTGTFDLAGSLTRPEADSSTTYNIIEGTLKITSYNSNFLSGTFSGKARVDSNSTAYDMQNGTIDKLPVQQ